MTSHSHVKWFMMGNIVLEGGKYLQNILLAACKTDRTKRDGIMQDHHYKECLKMDTEIYDMKILLKYYREVGETDDVHMSTTRQETESLSM